MADASPNANLGGLPLTDIYSAVRSTIGEAANQSPDVQRQVFSTIINRSNAEGVPVGDVARDTSVYQGQNSGPALHVNPDDPVYKTVLNNIAPVLQNGPTTDATHFYNPNGMPKGPDGRPVKPAWDNGTGKVDGAFLFLNRSDTLPQAKPPPDSAFTGGSTVPTTGPAAQQAAPEEQAPPDSAFANGSTTPGGAPVQQPDAATAQPALPPANVYGLSPPDLTPPKTLGDTLLRSLGADLRAFPNAVTGGLADKMDAGWAALPSLLQGGLPALQKQYTSNMNAEQQQEQADAQYVPFAHFPAQVAGFLTQGAALPEIKGLSLFGRGLVGAGQGALLGGANAIAGSRGSLAQAGQTAIPQMAEGALVGAPLGAVFGAGGQSAQGIASAADHAVAGVDPMLALNGSQPIQQAAQMLKGMPGVGAPLQAAARRTAGQLKGAVSGLASRLGTAQTPFEAGGAAVRGAQGAVANLKGAADKIYEPLNPLENSDVKIGALNTLSQIGKIKAKYPNIPGWLDQQAPKLAQVAKTLNGAGGRVTFGELKSMRTDVGKMIDDHMLVGNVDQARLEQLYGAMSQDMEAGVGTTAKAEAYRGGSSADEATRAATSATGTLKRANGFYSAMHNRIDNVLDSVVKARTNESAFHSIVSAARSGARADQQQLTLLKRSIDPQQWRNVAAGVVHTLGRDGNDNFSVDKFVTELDKLSPEGKKTLFGDDLSALESIGRVAKMQKAAGKFYNHSNSAHGVLSGMFGIELAEHLAQGHVKEAASIAALAPLGFGASKLLASPGFARLAMGMSKIKTPAAAQFANAALLKYANDNEPVGQLVNHYRQIFMNRLRSNVGAGLTSAATHEAPQMLGVAPQLQPAPSSAQR